jgi:hypothetical protein
VGGGGTSETQTKEGLFWLPKSTRIHIKKPLKVPKLRKSLRFESNGDRSLRTAEIETAYAWKDCVLVSKTHPPEHGLAIENCSKEVLEIHPAKTAEFVVILHEIQLSSLRSKTEQ